MGQSSNVLLAIDKEHTVPQKALDCGQGFYMIMHITTQKGSLPPSPQFMCMPMEMGPLNICDMPFRTPNITNGLKQNILSK